MTRAEAIAVLRAAGMPQAKILTQRYVDGTDYCVMDRTVDNAAALTGYKETLLDAVVAAIEKVRRLAS